MSTKIEELIDSMENLLRLAKSFVEDAERYILLMIYQIGKDNGEWTDIAIEAIRALECAFENIEEARSKLYDLRKECKEHTSTETEEKARN